VVNYSRLALLGALSPWGSHQPPGIDRQYVREWHEGTCEEDVVCSPEGHSSHHQIVANGLTASQETLLSPMSLCPLIPQPLLACRELSPPPPLETLAQWMTMVWDCKGYSNECCCVVLVLTSLLPADLYDDLLPPSSEALQDTFLQGKVHEVGRRCTVRCLSSFLTANFWFQMICAQLEEALQECRARLTTLQTSLNSATDEVRRCCL
jgi:hypothetical protein